MNSARKTPGAIYVSVALLVAVLSVIVDHLGVFRQVDNLFYDQIIRSRQRPASEDIVIIAVDEKSLEQVGRWPWRRERHTRLIKTLSEYAPAAIGVDLIFSEPDDDPNADRALATAMERNGRVVLPIVPVLNPKGGISERHPIEPLERAAARLGSVDAELDSDGISRSIFLLSGLGMPVWPSLPLAMLSLKNPETEESLPGTRSEEQGRYPDEWMRDHHVLVPFTGPPGHYRTISYVDALNGHITETDISGKFVLVGVTATGIGDRVPTPTTEHQYQMSGVEYMANVLDTLKADELIVALTEGYRAVIVFSIVFLTILLYPLLSVRYSIVLWCAAIIMVLIVTMTLFHYQRWFPPATALIGLLVSFPVWAWWGYRSSSQRISVVEQTHSAAMDAVEKGVIILDRELHIDHMNEMAERIIGTDIDSARGKRLKEVIPVIEIEGHGTGNQKGIETTPVVPSSISIPNREEGSREIFLRINPFSDRWGSIRGFVLNLSPDAASNMRMEEIGHIGMGADGLYSRSYISRFITDNIQNEPETSLYIFDIDIDNLVFITSNDNNKAIGTIFANYIARLRHSFGDDIPLARLGSNQLGLVLKCDSHEEAESIAKKIVGQATIPIKHDGGNSISLSVVIGISQYPVDGNDAETLLKKSSYAVHQQNRISNARYKFYSREDHELKLLDYGIEEELREAVERGNLRLHFQPQLSLTDYSLVGFEALLRWINGKGQEVSIGDVISVSEKSDLICDLSQWVIQKVFRQLRQWLNEDLPVGRISINLSPIDIERNRILEDIRINQEATSVPADMLEFEITEHSVIQKTDTSMRTLQVFQEMGIGLSIDDFGTGYSTFDYLKSMNVDAVKIDKSFIDNMSDIRDDAFIVMSMISMAHGLGVKVIAEGIEQLEQLRMLTNFNCDVIQGFLVSKPVPSGEVAAWIRQNCSKQDGKFCFNAPPEWNA